MEEKHAKSMNDAFQKQGILCMKKCFARWEGDVVKIMVINWATNINDDALKQAREEALYANVALSRSKAKTENMTVDTATKMMSRVTARIIKRDLVNAMECFKEAFEEHKATNRAMRRVGAMFKNKAVVFVMQGWKANLQEFLARQRAERIMRKVSANMLMKASVQVIAEFKKNYYQHDMEQKFASMDAARRQVLGQAEEEKERLTLEQRIELERLEDERKMAAAMTVAEKAEWRQQRAERVMRGVKAKMTMMEIVWSVSSWKANLKEYLQQLEAERKMKKVAAKLMQREVVWAVQGWKSNTQEYLNQERGGRLMRRVAAKIMMKEAVFALCNMKTNLKAHQKQSRGENMMRRVKGRMLMRETLFVVHAFRANWVDFKKKKRGEVMMRRVAARMMMKEVVHVIQLLKRKHQEARQKEKAERKMRRVAAKLLNKEIVFVMTSWKVNHLHEQMKAEGEAKMRRVANKMLYEKQSYAITNCKRNWLVDKEKARGERMLKRVGARMLQKEAVFAMQGLKRNYAAEKEEFSKQKRKGVMQKRVGVWLAKQGMSRQGLILNAFKRHKDQSQIERMGNTLSLEKEANLTAQDRAIEALSVETELRIRAEAELEGQKTLTEQLQANSIELAESHRIATLQMQEVQARVNELQDATMSNNAANGTLQKQAVLDKALREKLMQQLSAEREARDKGEIQVKQLLAEKKALEEEFTRHSAGAEAAVNSISRLQKEVSQLGAKEDDYRIIENELASVKADLRRCEEELNNRMRGADADQVKKENELASLRADLRRSESDLHLREADLRRIQYEFAGSRQDADAEGNKKQEAYLTLEESKKALEAQHRQLQGWYAELQAEVSDVLNRRDSSQQTVESLEAKLREREHHLKLSQDMEDQLRLELSQEHTFATSLEQKWQQWFEEALTHMPELKNSMTLRQPTSPQDSAIIARRAFEWVQDMHRSEWSVSNRT